MSRFIVFKNTEVAKTALCAQFASYRSACGVAKDLNDRPDNASAFVWRLGAPQEQGWVVVDMQPPGSTENSYSEHHRVDSDITRKLNGTRVTRVTDHRDVTVIFIPLPGPLWRSCGTCNCLHCKGREAFWDTLAVCATPGQPDTTWTVHMPEINPDRSK